MMFSLSQPLALWGRPTIKKERFLADEHRDVCLDLSDTKIKDSNFR
ncbi:unnamed protein product [marine sediment metagenome]|uniref:Uncharacterized protein n=1 Tax=marine sediment metagenome TaxID=412755 RepID=X1QEA0_9ZZZZ